MIMRHVPCSYMPTNACSCIDDHRRKRLYVDDGLKFYGRQSLEVLSTMITLSTMMIDDDR